MADMMFGEALRDVFGCGPVVFVDDEGCRAVTINGSYLNLFALGESAAVCVDCTTRDADPARGVKALVDLTWPEAMDAARAWVERIDFEAQALDLLEEHTFEVARLVLVDPKDRDLRDLALGGDADAIHEIVKRFFQGGGR